MRRNLPESLKIQALEHIKEGIPYKKISKMLGVSHTLISIIARKNGIQKVKKRLTESQREELKQIIAPDTNYAELASKYGVSRQYVSLLAKGLGVCKR